MHLFWKKEVTDSTFLPPVSVAKPVADGIIR
jgi:hypothetical protein